MNNFKFDILKNLTVKIGSGATPTGGQSSYKNEGISLIRSQNVYDMSFSKKGLAFIDEKQASKLDNVTVEENDILLNITGDSIARVCKVPKEILPARVNQHVSIIRTNSKIDSDFLLYYLIFRKDFLLTISNVGGTRNALTKEAVENIEVRLDDNDRKIAKILSVLDSKIELNNKINAELEQMAKTLYDYWFVQFDFPDVNDKPYKTSGGKMVWNEDLKREIPKGWEVETLSKWINNDKSGDWGKEHLEGNYNQRVYCVRGADINGLNGKGEVKSPERYILEKNVYKILEPYDLIVEISGGSPVQSTGRLAYITEETLHRFDAPIICSNFCKAVTLKNKYFFYNFVYQWNSVYDAGVLFGYEGKTSGIKNLLFESFVSSYYTAIPPTELAEKFYEFMKPLQIKKEKNLKENQELSSLRDWLLPMLMNGQVTINEIQAESQLDTIPKSKYADVISLFSIDNIEEEYYEKRKALAIYIINQSLSDVYFGDTKLMKILHLSDYHAIKRNFGQNYFQNVAGPFDGEFKNRFLKEIQDEGLFVVEKPRTKYIFKRGLNHKDSLLDNDYFSEGELRKVDSLITYFSSENYERPEIFSTLYAVWNNRLIANQEVSPKLLKQDFINWDKSKEKYADQVYVELDNMKMMEIVPDGWGRFIGKAKR